MADNVENNVENVGNSVDANSDEYVLATKGIEAIKPRLPGAKKAEIAEQKSFITLYETAKNSGTEEKTWVPAVLGFEVDKTDGVSVSKMTIYENSSALLSSDLLEIFIVANEHVQRLHDITFAGVNTVEIAFEEIAGRKYQVYIRKPSFKATLVTPESKKTTEEFLADIQARTGLTEEDFNRRIAQIERYGFKRESEVFREVVNLMGRQPEGEEIPKPKITYIQDEQRVIQRLLTYCVHGNVVLEGSKSLGKNVAWETVSWLLNRKSFMLSCGEGLTMSTIFGFLSTDNSAIDGLTEDELKIMYDNEAEGKVDNKAKARVMLKVFQNMSPKLVLSQGVVTEALLWENAGYGALLILDEMNMADPNILSQSFNTLTDKHAPTIHIDTYGNVPIPSTFLMGATQNGTGGAYFGTQMQNDATMSRWSVIRLRNSKSIKPALKGADRADEVEEEVLDMLDNVFRAFQNQVSLGNAPEGCLNLRGFKQAVNAIALGIDRVSAIEDCVLNSLPESTSIQTLRSILDEYVE